MPRDTTPPNYRCRACKSLWWASEWHCVFCHQTFAHDVSGRHRDPKSINCHDPATSMGWELNDGCWMPPAPKEKTAVDTIMEVVREFAIDEQSLVKRALRWRPASNPSSDG